ncbi:hypothetical protein SISNIDRAFT_482524 [Sistotremastrum niveocremeum HHB9708]|uniref:Ricin B lectin domain-containing protein n=1 Tax=Sistotremastrum niveocremeum HHB9708 TaxID=1314777 RepID=A0A164YA77_9AGAM|nr:hypothetical protein SISNIDRAFT_482524 [Sistotremastrum niveocremeum HHB9708]
MPLEEGVYDIKNIVKQKPLLVFSNSDEGTPVAAIDSKGSWQTKFVVKWIAGSRYTITSQALTWNVGANNEKNYPFATRHYFEWAIEEAGNGTYRIHEPYDNSYLYLPEGEGTVRVLKRGATGGDDEKWNFVKEK